MLILTIILFALAAALGSAVMVQIINDRETNKPVAYAHGAVAAIALALLIIYAISNPASYPRISLILFIVAALGGFVLFGKDLMGKPGPKALALIHGLAAVAAFVLLLIFAIG